MGNKPPFHLFWAFSSLQSHRDLLRSPLDSFLESETLLFPFRFQILIIHLHFIQTEKKNTRWVTTICTKKREISPKVTQNSLWKSHSSFFLFLFRHEETLRFCLFKFFFFFLGSPREGVRNRVAKSVLPWQKLKRVIVSSNKETTQIPIMMIRGQLQERLPKGFWEGSKIKANLRANWQRK